MADISDKHQRFARLYVKYGNATKAYQEVYPDSSYDATRNSASQLLAKPHVKAEIKRINDNIMDEVGLTKERLLEMTLETYAKAGMVYKTNDQLKAIEMLGRERGMFTPKVEQNVSMETTYTLDMGRELDEEEED